MYAVCVDPLEYGILGTKIPMRCQRAMSREGRLMKSQKECVPSHGGFPRVGDYVTSACKPREEDSARSQFGALIQLISGQT